MQLTIPILLILRDSPRAASATMRVLQSVKPSRLYIYAIPSPEDLPDFEESGVLREIEALVDWPCKLTLEALASDRALEDPTCAAISSFFDAEERGIILDEGIPSEEFFKFCEWGLANYADQKEVWHINGCNYSAPPHLFGNAQATFASIADTTCWATWRDRWRLCNVNPFYIDRLPEISGLQMSGLARLNLLRLVDQLQMGAGRWDALLQVAILNGAGMVLCPKENLVTPAGSRSTEPHRSAPHARIASKPTDRPEMALNRRLSRWYEAKKGLRSWGKALHHFMVMRVRRLRLAGNRLFARLLFGKTPEKIIVASNGRSGSTMLCESIAEGLARQRFGPGLVSRFSEFLCEVAIEFAPRLQMISPFSAPIIKTHDRPDNSSEIYGKVIFVFGDPLESALSTWLRIKRDGYIWFHEHLYHLRADARCGRLLESDLLGFKEQCRLWNASPRNSVLLVPFDELWDRQSEISQFLGFRIELPNRKTRRPKPPLSKINKEIFDELHREYERMVQLAHERFELQN